MTGPENSVQRNWPAAVEITEVALSYQYSAALRAVAVAGIADHLAAGPLAVGELADRAGVSAPHLDRVLRMLAGRGVFAEHEGVFGLTEQAELLRADAPGSVREWLLMITDDTFWLPAAQLATTVRNGATVFPDIFGGRFFDYLERTGGAAAFHRGMGSFSDGENPDVAAALPVESGTVVDVGGGRGSLLAAILRRHPRTTGVLLDRADAVAEHVLDQPDLTGRWRTETGDFFTSVPPGAESYVIKRVMHDWTDEECVRILQVIREAIPDNGRVFIVDGIMPAGTQPHPVRTLDLVMMTSLDGRERHEQEFRDLLNRSGFDFVRVITTNWTMTVIEAHPANQEPHP